MNKQQSTSEDVRIPDLFTVSPSPHLKHRDTTRTIMLDVVIALVPVLLWGIYLYGFRALTVVMVTIVSSVAFEALTEWILKRPITVTDGSAVVTGLLLGLNLPVSVPLWMPVAGAFFAIVVVKQIFGGLGKNIVNPALAARVFLFAWPTHMSTYIAPGVKPPVFAINVPDAVTSATPLASVNAGDLSHFSHFDLFFGNTGGCIGEVSAVLLLCGGIYLLLRRTITWHIPVTFVGTVAVLTYLFPIGDGGEQFMLAQILSGGLMLGAIFMATDYVTSPITGWGKVIFGVGCGLITVFIRYFGGYNEGVSFAILIMNLFTYYLDQLTKPVKFGGRSHGKS